MAEVEHLHEFLELRIAHPANAETLHLFDSAREAMNRGIVEVYLGRFFLLLFLARKIDMRDLRTLEVRQRERRQLERLFVRFRFRVHFLLFGFDRLSLHFFSAIGCFRC